MSNESKHIGLGALTAKVGLTKSNITEVLEFGAGVAAFPVVYSLARGAALQSFPQLAQNTWLERGVRALSGIVLGTVVAKLVKGRVGTHIGEGIAGAAVGSVIMDVVTPYLNPTVAAVQASTAEAEATTGEAQVSGTNPMGRGLQGLGRVAARGRGRGRGRSANALLFGVGTPDMSAAGMFGGASVAIEDRSGPMSGATVAIEQPGFASSLA